jgi:hypothetical protein
MALILALPLERIGELPLERFAREAPLLCAQVIRALGSDDELERIARASRAAPDATSPARRLAEMTGARDGQAAVGAVEALRGVLWEALLDELRWSSLDQSVDARMVADLADRLAYVCSSALVSSLGESRAPSRAPEAPVPAGTRVIAEALAASSRAPAAAGAVAQARRSALGNGVVIVDEAPPQARRTPRVRQARPGERPSVYPSSAARRPQGRALPWDTPLQRRDDRS